MTLEELHILIAAGESQTLELKKSTAEKERACRSLCALANGQGGHVVFGITPTGKVVGQKVTDRTLEELAQEFQGFEPPLTPNIQRIPLADGNAENLDVLLLHTKPATHPPVSFRGVPYERVLNPEEYLNCDLKALVHGGKPAKNRNELESKVRGAMMKIQNRPKRVISYFRHRNIQYAA